MTPHSSTLAWETPWTEEPGGLQSLGLQRVRDMTEHKHEHLKSQGLHMCIFIRQIHIH